MFIKKNEEPKHDYQSQIREIESNHQLKIKEIESNHKLELKEKEFELRHFKDDAIKELETKVSDSAKQIAVLQKENEMLQKITDLNSDIIDVKELVNSLIKKLPEINLQNLTINGTGK